jgi:hypothetical protein
MNPHEADIRANLRFDAIAAAPLREADERLAAEGLIDVPAPKVRACRVCGCTDDRVCPGGCWWAGPDPCSRCEGRS